MHKTYAVKSLRTTLVFKLDSIIYYYVWKAYSIDLSFQKYNAL